MKTVKSMSVVLAIGLMATGGRAALAEVAVGAAPDGLTLFASVDGAMGTPGNAGSWFVGEGGRSLFTYWSGDEVSYAIVLPESVSGWSLGVTAQNVAGPLTAGYTDFNVSVGVNGVGLKTMNIPASDTAWSTAWIDLGQRSGPTTVTLRWNNDSWNPGIGDANISYGALSFASMSVPSAGTGVLMLSGMGVLLLRVRRPV